MRCLLFVVALLLCATAARADSLADLRQPSSTIAGCVNDWGPFGTGPGVVESTCEGKAALVEWNRHAAAIYAARDVLVRASDLPLDRTDPRAVIEALNTCGTAADGLAGLDHQQQPGTGEFFAVLAWMRPWFAREKLPAPGSIGDGFRLIARALQRPDLSRQDRKALYGQASVFAFRTSRLAAEQGEDVQRQTDAAVRAAHLAALQIARAVENGIPQPDAAARIAAAAGPGFATIAEGQTNQLERSLAAHPDQGRYRAQAGRALGGIPAAFFWIIAIALALVILAFPRLYVRLGRAGAVNVSLLVLLALPLSWLPLALLHAITFWPDGWVALVLWLGLFVTLLIAGPRLLPGRLRRVWMALFSPALPPTHGSARFGTARDAAKWKHLAPTAPADAFTLGELAEAPKGADRRFRHDGHVLTCAPTGAGKGIGAVIPNLLTYPGSAFVLDLKGETYAVTARARREIGQEVYLIDPFGIAGGRGQAMNWLDALDPDDPEVVSLSGALADMLVIGTGGESDPHWNDTARELLRGLLVHVATLPPARRTMAELRRILTASEDDLAVTLAEMLAEPERGQSLPARTATTHLNRPERERGSVLSTAIRHTAWLDDPRLCAALTRSDFSLRDLKHRKMTIYVAIPPDRLRACLGFVRGFIGLALDAITATPGKPQHRVAFFLDEFGQLGRMDRLADSITLLRGYGAQLWLFVQDLSQLRAVYPRWQSFMANTTRQFFGTADYDTARYISDALGQHTISFETENRSWHAGHGLKPGSFSGGRGEHRSGRPLLTPDEVARLGPERPIIMISGEPPYLLNRINYLTDPAFAGCFDANPMHGDWRWTDGQAEPERASEASTAASGRRARGI